MVSLGLGGPLAPRIFFWVCGIVACVCGNTLELHPADAKIRLGEIVFFVFNFMRRVLV